MAVKFTDLEPRYFVRGQSEQPVGITFACPHCPDSGTRLAIAIHLDGTNFDPDPSDPQQFETDEHVWTITGGSTFDDLSLSPSVDASKSGHWHGFITGGEAR
jgi:hypothetical protein